jgi:DNA-binding NtrC family response regulator
MEILGDSLQIREINQIIRQVAPTDISVLITGESGTGKEVVANEIHRLSKRKERPLITVNCGAIPEGIIESELFGHQKGAFTGAFETRAGYFETADNGTIFLDEIGDTPLATQVKLLRVLESGQYMKVGGNKNLSADVRIIAATNKNLATEVINRNFREDLYFRLKSVNIHIPPLRERKSDVKILFDHFVSRFCSENNIIFGGIDDDAMEYLLNYVWYGNARELRNFCESILVLYPGKRITVEDVKKNLHQEIVETTRHLPAIPAVSRDLSEKDLIIRALLELKTDLIDVKNLIRLNQNKIPQEEFNDSDFKLKKNDMMEMDIDEIEKEILVYLLKIHNWDIKKVSDNLKQSQRNIYRKIRKYQIRKI